MSVSDTLPIESRLPGFEGATGWLNSPPLTAVGLRGQVVVVDFWTYTCINWLRTLGYVRAWAEKYRDAGVVVVGVHTPEFPFERDVENVRRAVSAMRVDHPVAIDTDYAVWRAFNNHYWPALYIADAEGRIRYHHFGEGAYDECERVIQRLLRETGSGSVSDDLIAIAPEGVEAQADWGNLESPETYLGYEQGQNFAAGDDVRPDLPRSYAVPDELPRNRWALAGEWTIEERASVLSAAEGAIAFRFHARDVNLVIRSREGTRIPFQVLLNGEVPGSAHGHDVDSEGNGMLVEPRLYQLVRQPGQVVDRTFGITFSAPGVEAYVFTFG
jgi:thiol-disulfide isomerase/thioredoxin